jgi:glutathione S-transferase
MIKVYGRANSINVRRVLWMLDEVGEPFEREDWGRGYRSVDEPTFRALNPVGVVPVIDDGDFRLRESNTIVRYLARKHNRTDLYPDDLRKRALTETFMDWSSTDFGRGMTPVFHGLIVKNPAYANQVEAGIQEWSRQMQVLDTHLSKSGPYVMGQAFTIGDIPVGLVVNRWYAIDFKKPDFPAVAAYYDRLTQRPGYRAHGRNGTP